MFVNLIIFSKNKAQKKKPAPAKPAAAAVEEKKEDKRADRRRDGRGRGRGGPRGDRRPRRVSSTPHEN